MSDDAARNLTRCVGCGKEKSKGLIVCWDCFKGGKTPFKYFTGTLKEWLKAK